MRKNFGEKPMCYPMPVYIVGTYSEDDTPNAMNAAWGGISEETEISSGVMDKFAVIDTETNWADRVMSVGVVIADADSLQMIEGKYYVLTPEYLVGGMFSDTLFADSSLQPVVCSRCQALGEIVRWLGGHGVRSLFAYNATFDRNHLPELQNFEWYDIMRLAAYRQYNRKIPQCADCYSTGRLKRGYGVEPILQLLSGNRTYHETHNALYDAMDELEIMRLLGCSLAAYIPL